MAFGLLTVAVQEPGPAQCLIDNGASVVDLLAEFKERDLRRGERRERRGWRKRIGRKRIGRKRREREGEGGRQRAR